MMLKMERLLNPWIQEEVEDGDGGEEESDIFGLTDLSEVDVTRTSFISWFHGGGGGGGEEEEDGNEEEEEEEKENEEEEDDGDEEDGDEEEEGEEDSDEEEEEEEDGDEEEEEEGEDGGGEESDILGLSDQPEVQVNRSSFISWFATKAASIFLGTKEEYIQDLENLLPKEEGGDDYVVLCIANTVLKDRFRKINEDLMIWWLNKAASVLVMETNFTQRLVNPLPARTTPVAVVSSRTEAVNMVGSTDLFCEIRDELLEDSERARTYIIVGMAGIGKTALAKKIIQDPLISSKFKCCVFVRMGPESNWEEAVQAILAQMPGSDKMVMEDKSLCKILNDRKCLIVLDDLWGPNASKIFNICPWGKSKSVILLTTRINGVVQPVDGIYQVPFLNKDESWDLLHRKIFGEKRCPRELEKAGKTIAENCEGLPLLILTVGSLLSHAEKTPEYWSKIAENKTNSIFVDAYEQVSGVVYPSYYYLPQKLKACFLYLAAFPQNDELRVSRLISLWSADGFLGLPYTTLQLYAGDFLGEIVSHNVALGTQLNYSKKELKVLSLHSVFWYLCKREAMKEKFLHVLNSYRDASVEGIKRQRRLSIYKNIIFSIKDARDSIASISALQSLLCTGPYLQYQVPMCLGDLKLLKVLDALTIRFYEFPTEVLKLLQLRYLALTCNGNLPPSISNLWGLQCLMLHQHLSIKSSVSSHSYLPVEIWDLQELEHLEIIGRNLPDPPPGAVLGKLLILLDVGVHTCTERVLASIPNLEKLRVQIELTPAVAAEQLRFSDDISHLKGLRSLQFAVVNPELEFKAVALPALVSLSYLTKLTLSGFGYPWEDIHKIAELPLLQVLKLKCYAFRGEKWAVKREEFRALNYLSIEDTDLVQWTAGYQTLASVEYVTIKNCYRLVELPKLSPYLREIQVVDCNPSAETCAKQVRSSHCRVYIESSWLGDGKLSQVEFLKNE